MSDEIERLERAVIDAAVAWRDVTVLEWNDPTEYETLAQVVDVLIEVRKRAGKLKHPFRPHHLAEIPRYADVCVEVVADGAGHYLICGRPRPEHVS